MTGDGLAALGFTSLSYGATELIHGYGFVAVFVTALTLRSVERESAFHHQLHDFGEQIERLLTMVVLVCFGSNRRWRSVRGGGLAHCHSRSAGPRRRPAAGGLDEPCRVSASLDLLSGLCDRCRIVHRYADDLGDDFHRYPTFSRHAWCHGHAGHAVDRPGARR